MLLLLARPMITCGTCTTAAMQRADLWGLDANVLVQLRMSQRELDSLLDLGDLLLQAAHICIRLQWRLLNL